MLVCVCVCVCVLCVCVCCVCARAEFDAAMPSIPHSAMFYYSVWVMERYSLQQHWDLCVCVSVCVCVCVCVCV